VEVVVHPDTQVAVVQADTVHLLLVKVLVVGQVQNPDKVLVQVLIL
jgi:hypothetical protein